MPVKHLKWRVTKDGCFEPTSHTTHDGKGYPVYIRDGKVRRMYRYRYEQKHGPVQPGLVVRHTCDNRKCINVNHLIVGTRADNMHDKTARGRTVKGEKNGHSKLIEAEVLFILRSTQSNIKLSKKFGVSPDAVSLIRSGKRWKHITQISTL